MNRRMLIAAMAVLAATLGAEEARAFCFENRAAAAVHVEALAPNGFVADLAPGQTACCAGGTCAAGPVPILLMTGYVPVTKGRPGWSAECRVRVRAGDRITVRGNESRISCAADGD